MERLAEQVSEALQTEFGEECLVGVSYYDEDEVGHVYRSEWATEKYEPEQVDEIVRDIQLEAIGYGAHERRQDEELHATVRIYDEMLDVAVPIDDRRGIGVALDKDGDYSVREAVAVIERTVEDSEIEPSSRG